MNTETVKIVPKGDGFEIIIQHDQSGGSYGCPLSKNAYDQLRNQMLSNVLSEQPKQQVTETIKVLTEVVNANKGWLGSEALMKEANAKIKELIKKL